MPDKLPTTVIGSFPKPDYLPIRDWFDSARDRGTMNAPEVTQGYSAYSMSDSDEALFVQAAKEVIGLQVDAGIDVPTDGEVRRENYIHYHCRHVTGFDFVDLEHRVLRDGAYETDLPAIRGMSATIPRPTVHMISRQASRSVASRSNSPCRGH